MGTQQFCLKWNNHQSNMLTVFEQLLSTEALVDVTLACDGLSLKAHKMVLSACSPFFQSLFLENPCKHPIVIMKDMRYSDLKAIIDFMYRGEVNVSHDQLNALLRTAETLKVKGLAEVSGENRTASGMVQQEIVQQNITTTQTPSSGPPSQTRSDSPPLHSKRKRGRPRKRSLSDSNRSDDDSAPPKIKEPDSPEIEELSNDTSHDANDISQNISSNSQTQVHPSLQSSAVHNSLSKTLPNISSIQASQESQVEEPASDDGDFEVEPSKLMEQSLTTDVSVMSNSQAQNTIAPSSVHLPLPSSSGLIDNSRSLVPTTGGDSQSLVPVSVSIPPDSLSSSQMQGPDSPQDIKPTAFLSIEEPPISPVAGPSHQSDRSMMMYMDTSGVPAIPGTSFQQDSQSAIVQHESQPQGSLKDLSGNMILPLDYPYRPQLYVVDGDVWQSQDDEIEIVEDPDPDSADTEYNFVDSKYSTMFQLSLTGDSDDSDKISENTPLPEFSDFVRNHLVENNLSAIWGLFIDECAKYYYGKFPTIQNSSEYQTIGRKMFEKFPSIAYEGKEPWSFFCKSLSQKIRHIKWKNKKKSSLRGQCSSKTRSPTKRKPDYVAAKLRSIKRNADRKHIPGKYYKVALSELHEGWFNSAISEERVKNILKHTFKSRHHWVTKLATKRLKPVLEEYPCFSVGKYVIYDFLMLTNKDDTSELLKKMETLFSVVGSMMVPQVTGVDDIKAIKVLNYMEDQIAFAKDKKGLPKSIVVHQSDVPDGDVTDLLKTEESTPPYVVMFTKDNKIASSYIVGDNKMIETEATSFYEALIVLIATYFTFNLKYPKCFSQVLGLLQTYATEQVYTGIKSYNYSTFVKKVDKRFSRIK